MNSSSTRKRRRFLSLSRRDPEVGQQLVRNPLTRRLRIERLEDRRMLAPLVGVDFFLGSEQNDLPSGWRGISSFLNGETFTDLGNTDIDITLTTDGERRFLSKSPSSETIPIPGAPLLSLVGIDGLLNLRDLRSPGGILLEEAKFQATWSGLKSNTPYEIYVFGLDPVFLFQTVQITGMDTIKFSQITNSEDLPLIVNHDIGIAGQLLTRFMEEFKPDGNNEISIEITSKFFNLGVAGLGIREGIPVDSNSCQELSEAFSIANLTLGDDFILVEKDVGEFTCNNQIDVFGTVFINGQGALVVGGGSNRLFNAQLGEDESFYIYNLGLKNGVSPCDGGAIVVGEDQDEPCGVPAILSGTPDFGAASDGEATGSLIIEDSLITGNKTTGVGADGGAIFSTGDVTIINSVISGNNTEGNAAYGGAISVDGLLTISGSTIEDNYTLGTTAMGGGIHANGDATLTDSIVRNNNTWGAYSNGGGIANGGLASSGTISLNRTTVSGNRVMGFSASGGGIYSARDLTIKDSRITQNYTFGDFSHGGGIRSYGATISGSTISGNATVGNFSDGGGISSVSPVSVSSSTISGNRVFGTNSDGGGVFVGGDATINQSTVTNNHAYGPGSRGGGVISFANNVILDGSIVAANTAGAMGPDVFQAFGTSTANYSLIGDAAGATIAGTGNIVGDSLGAGIVDPMLGPLDNNGGSTETHLPLPGSPAIDVGEPVVPLLPTYDQRGFAFARTINGRPDMGSVESGAVSANFDYDNDIDGSDFLRWQRGFGTSPDALHKEGDADINGVVDALDLAVWLLTYGQVEVTPVVAAVASEQSEVSRAESLDSGPSVGSSQPIRSVASADLIDAAMAMEWFDVGADEEPVLEEEISVEAALAAIHTPIGRAAATSARVDASRALPEALEEPDDEPWLAETLLERVFG